jgi:ectoine hydroxylase-related dioxygenase (phytanoyl-CoA dioxygenase family)
MRRLLTEGPIVEMASELLGQPAVLFKEKINYKHPGGAGFAAHQDQVAYPQITRSVTCLLAVDAAGADNGCLEFAAGGHEVLLTPDSEGCIPRHVAAALSWTATPVEAGSLVWFHGLAPHRSGPNRTSRSRRAVYVTYNARSEGDARAAYYADKRRVLKAAPPGARERISLIGHFQGRPAPRSQDEG